MIVMDKLEQGTGDWLRERLGVLTASQVVRLLTPTGKLSSQRTGLVATLAAERILQEPVDDFQGTYWTERGAALEDQALAYFELQTGLTTHRVGFAYRDDSKTCGCSPDSLVADGDGEVVAGLELKCPKAATHVGYVLDQDAQKYAPQVQFSLWVTGLPAWYFMSYYERLTPFLVKVYPDPKWQKAFSDNVPILLKEVDEAVAKIAA